VGGAGVVVYVIVSSSTVGVVVSVSAGEPQADSASRMTMIVIAYLIIGLSFSALPNEWLGEDERT